VARQNFILKHIKEAPEIRRSLLFVGLFTRVANELGVTASHVNRVAKGQCTSKHVSDAIIREVRRIERRTERAA
jgi:hypothetical protein